MRFGFLLLGLAACGGPAPDQASPRQAGNATRAAETAPLLVGGWTLRRADGGRSGIRLEVRVDSVARDSAFGALTFYMAGDAGFLIPSDWGSLVGTMLGDSVRMVVQAGARAPEIGLAGRTVVDTVRLTTFRIGADFMLGTWMLVRTTVSRP